MKTVTITVAGRRYTIGTSLNENDIRLMEKQLQETLERLQLKHPSADLIDLLVFCLIEGWEQNFTLQQTLQHCVQSKELLRARLQKIGSIIEKKIKDLTGDQ